MLPWKLFAHTAPPTPNPPVITTAPLVLLVEAVLLVNVVSPFDVSVVNAPVLAVVLPIGVLFNDVIVNVPSTFKLPSISTSSANLTVEVVAPITTLEAPPAKLTVVALAFIRLNVVAVVVRSPPRTAKSKSTVKLLLTLVVPVAAPISIAVAAPAKFTVVAVPFTRLNVVWFVAMSPPLTFKSPFSVTVALRIVAVPVAAPIVSVVAAPNALTVVAVVLKISMLALPATTLVVIVGLVPNTRTPLPVSSLITPAS